MKNQIQLFDISLPSKREEVANRENINKLLSQINGLNNIIFSFDTKEDIKEAKTFKTNANKFIKEFKEFCDPLEEEGRTIAKTRSEVKLTLERIVDSKLKPIVDVENHIKSLKDKIFIPSSDANSCNTKLEWLKQFENYEWFALKDEALTLITQLKTLLENELLGFEKQAKEKAEAEERIRLEREEEIRKNAIAETELRLKKEQEAREAAIKAQEFISKPVVITEPRIEASNIDQKRKIYNDMIDAISQFDTKDKEGCKALIKAIADGKILGLYIKCL